ncbi:hypothetical protein BU23DRAFT_575712 [Bimuria novae-zelandiae CBS 107.79]|uniref:Uncharacterized protein n=1 Tax=Bimuria novae-zelandiae CBS 107.79 TaxID=1447943 RepID=A0A6A5UKU7_9PLEO|nr:hypothetical protein BU23DRAFT_575712 [Bimuria novae-zelandiae CBS 107.79]
MPKQPMKKRGAEVHTPYSHSDNEASSSSETDNSNILGIDNAGDEGLSAAVILLHLSTEAAEQEAVECFPESDTEAYLLPHEASTNRQESPVKDEVDSRTVEEARTQPGDPDETMLVYVIPVCDRPRPGHCDSLAEGMGDQIQEFRWSIHLDVTCVILSTYFDLDAEYSVPRPICKQRSELSHRGRIEGGGSTNTTSLR